MKRKHKTYSEEFRREAVRLAESGAKPLTQIARELGIHLETLRGWQRRYRRGRGHRRENERLREEREILKKATAFFAKDAR